MAECCDWDVRRAKGDKFVFVPCGRKATFTVDGHPRCRVHAFAQLVGDNPKVQPKEKP